MSRRYAQALADIAKTTEVDLDLANSLYAPNGTLFDADFLASAQKNFDARVRLLNYQDPASVVVMNSYICQKTKGKIASILGSASDLSDERMLLLNAAYFHGFWNVGFDRDKTSETQFETADGGSTFRALMQRRGIIAYQRQAQYEAVRLPYGESERFALYAFLPAFSGNAGLTAVLNALSLGGFANACRRFLPCHGDLFLPRLRVEYASNFQSSFQRLGLSSILDSSTDDLNAAKGAGGKLGMRHRAAVELDEAGPLVKPKDRPLRLRSFIVGAPFYLKFDRSFCFLVRDELNGSISMAGIVNQTNA
jgi:serpin B